MPFYYDKKLVLTNAALLRFVLIVPIIGKT